MKNLYIVYWQIGPSRANARHVYAFELESDAIEYISYDFPTYEREDDILFWYNEEGDRIWIETIQVKTAEEMAEDRRYCAECGKRVVLGGYTVEDGSWHCCYDCFENLLERGKFKPSDSAVETGEPNECDGFYDELIGGEYEPSTVYWTNWR